MLKLKKYIFFSNKYEDFLVEKYNINIKKFSFTDFVRTPLMMDVK